MPVDEHAEQQKAPFHTAVARAVWWMLRSRVTVQLLWIVNVTLFCGLVLWILRDGKFSNSVLMLQGKVSLFMRTGSTALAGGWYAGRVLILEVVTVMAGVSAVGIFLGLFFGAAPHRRVRSWFAFTMLLAAWLTLFGSWRELAWQGQILRLRNRLDGIESIAAPLRTDWPNIDGDLLGLGPFMAYPIGRPTMLMMLTSPDVPHTNASISSVERGENGALRFSLVGDEPGTWLEWHPPGSVPESFVGGLHSDYSLDRFVPLGGNWFLVRYNSAESPRERATAWKHRNAAPPARPADN